MITIKAGTDHCELCGKKAELRPYGANGELICYDCGMKDEETTSARFSAILEQGAVVLDLTDQEGTPSLEQDSKSKQEKPFRDGHEDFEDDMK